MSMTVDEKYIELQLCVVRLEDNDKNNISMYTNIYNLLASIETRLIGSINSENSGILEFFRK